jgi:integrase/recombinase XerD
MADLELFLNRFKQYLELNNFARPTINSYIQLLESFFEFLAGAGIDSVYQLNKEHIVSYQKELFYRINHFGRVDTPETRNNHLKAIKKFCRFLKQEDYMSADIAKDVDYAKVPHTLPRTILTREEIEELLRQPDIHTPIGYRDRAILELLYSTGIRCQELLNLKPADLDLEQGFVRIIQGKGGKDRVVPLGQVACKYLHSYLTFVRPELLRHYNHGYLFVSYTGSHLCGQGLRILICRYTKLAGLTKHVTTHVFRHTMATHLVQEDANIRCVQEILGHTNVNTTQRYTQVTIVDLKKAHQKCHPREQGLENEESKTEVPPAIESENPAEKEEA